MKVIQSILEEKVHLDGWAKESYQKTGYIRWQSVMHFYSINYVKAGFLIKEKGNWYITPDGEDALKNGATCIFLEAKEKYKDWIQLREDKHRGSDKQKNPEEEKPPEEIELPSQHREEAEAQSRKSFEDHIKKKNAYEFQALCAALLRGMGYFVPHVSPKGKDGGIDIIAYQDPIGASPIKIVVQVKHYIGSGQKVRSDEIDKLAGNIKSSSGGNVGSFITSSDFSSEARNKYRMNHPHIELINLNKFIDLWCCFYSKMTDEDKALMPVKSIYFLDNIER
ncbi:MAG: restriction endonuclease [Holosporaceae bacterium]|nr:restriction endonuclease [Holosporaceae bacterium]